jgi:hypothetical protein
MAALVGTVRPNGRIQFLKKQNEWVFANIAKSSKPIERIKLNPLQQPIEIQQPEADSDTDFPWLDDFRAKLKTAEAIFLSHKNGALRFGSAIHTLDDNRKFYTIGTAQEAQKFSNERWSNIRYFFANKCDDFRFFMTSLMTFKKGKVVEGGRIELPVRVETIEGIDRPVTLFDATGSNATMEIVDWRGTVSLGSVGRFAIEDKKVQLMVTRIDEPFTFMEEYREEFKNFAYTFHCDKTKLRFDKLIAKKLKSLETSA